MSNPIHQTVIFKVSPHEVYEALMDEKMHARCTLCAASGTPKRRTSSPRLSIPVTWRRVNLMNPPRLAHPSKSNVSIQAEWVNAFSKNLTGFRSSSINRTELEARIFDRSASG